MSFQANQLEGYSAVVLQPSHGFLSDDEFFEFCRQYPGYRIETTAEGDIEILSPVNTPTGRRNARITARLNAWAEQDGTGDTFDSSTMFRLNNGARRSPDAAWVSSDRLKLLVQDDSVWRVAPDFVIELKSKTDRLSALRAKMREWISNGVTLGWLINPETRTVEIYRADGSVEEIVNAAELRGEGPVTGFVLPLAPIWQ
jgi:Uma2 family endonuclease